MSLLMILVLLLAGATGWWLWERSHRRTHSMEGGLRRDIDLPHEQEWELYHNALSLCSKKARVCLAELGIDYRGHHIDLIETGSYENISRGFLRVNPAGLVPVLVHNGHPIYESHEQIAYAAAHAPEGSPRLVPEDPDQRAAMERWVHASSLIGDRPIDDMAATAGNCIPGLTLPLFATMVVDIPYARIVEGLLFHRLKERPLLFLLLKALGLGRVAKLPKVAALVGASRRQMEKHLDGLEAQLAETGGPWILGEMFTLADVGWLVIFERLAEANWLDGIVDDRYPRVRQYWQALQARPSYQTAIRDFGHPTIARGRERLVAANASVPSVRKLYEARS